MIPKRIDLVEKSDIQLLLDEQVPEGRTLDYKEALPAGDDAGKREFLADVSSFANAVGGDLVYGVKEARDANNTPTGLPDAIIGLPILNADKEILRLTESVRSGVEPRIQGLDMRAIDGFQGGPVLVIRVPKSYSAPHMVTYKGTSRFYGRSGAGKYQLGVGEIRAAFDLSGSQAERIRAFRDERIARVLADDTPVPLMSGAKAILILYPLSALTAETINLDISAKNRLVSVPLFCSSLGGMNVRHNFDGLFGFAPPTKEKPSLGYVQIYRIGIGEVVSRALFNDAYTEGERSLRGGLTERDVLDTMDILLGQLRAAEVRLPIIAMLAFVDVKGFVMYIGPGTPRDPSRLHPIDKDVLIFPEILLDEEVSNLGKALRPWFDAIWQATGHPESPNYDQNSDWIRPRR